jgi:hypothetical protein
LPAGSARGGIERLASGDAARRAISECCRAGVRIAIVTDLVALVERPGFVVHRVAELAERRAVRIDTGARAARRLGHAGSDAISEGEKALRAVPFVTDLVAVVGGTRACIGFVTQLTQDRAFSAAVGRRATLALPLTTVSCSGRCAHAGRVVVITTGRESEDCSTQK